MQLSSATRERLWARSNGQTSTASSGTSGAQTASTGHTGQFDEKSTRNFQKLKSEYSRRKNGKYP